MILDFTNIAETSLPQFRGGMKDYRLRAFADEDAKIMLGRLEPGASIGVHRHEDNCEILYVLSGTGLARYDDACERLAPGTAHYCPKGHSHGIENDGTIDLLFFAVVPRL